ncbi:hypothetical protein T492DRAFT_1055605 [Pavlovales sp. CCMP2436]|nr:hypothetical protein T492DRAFT_1055605 [Pavlovales sp. CCMP2436]
MAAEPMIVPLGGFAQTLLRVKRPREAPSHPSLTVFNDAPTCRQRVSMSALRLQKDGMGPTVRQYRLLVAGGGEPSTPAPPKHHEALTTASMAAFHARERSRQVHDQRANSFRYKCVQERRMKASDALTHIGGSGHAAISVRHVRMLDLELKPETRKPGSKPQPITPFGPPTPPTPSALANCAEQAAPSEADSPDSFVYDVYLADESGASAQPSTDAVMYIEYDDDGPEDDEFRSDASDSDHSTEDSNAEGHYANDYPESDPGSSDSDDEARAVRLEGSGSDSNDSTAARRKKLGRKAGDAESRREGGIVVARGQARLASLATAADMGDELPAPPDSDSDDGQPLPPPPDPESSDESDDSD